MINKPKKYPLGIEPKRYWKLERYNNLKDTIQRYQDANLPIPAEWIDEYNELLIKLSKEFNN